MSILIGKISKSFKAETNKKIKAFGDVIHKAHNDKSKIKSRFEKLKEKYDEKVKENEYLFEQNKKLTTQWLDLHNLIISKDTHIKKLDEILKAKEPHRFDQTNGIPTVENKLLNEIFQIVDKFELENIACNDKNWIQIDTLIRKVRLFSDQLNIDFHSL